MPLSYPEAMTVSIKFIKYCLPMIVITKAITIINKGPKIVFVT